MRYLRTMLRVEQVGHRQVGSIAGFCRRKLALLKENNRIDMEGFGNLFESVNGR